MRTTGRPGEGSAFAPRPPVRQGRWPLEPRAPAPRSSGGGRTDPGSEVERRPRGRPDSRGQGRDGGVRPSGSARSGRSRARRRRWMILPRMGGGVLGQGPEHRVQLAQDDLRRRVLACAVRRAGGVAGSAAAIGEVGQDRHGVRRARRRGGLLDPLPWDACRGARGPRLVGAGTCPQGGPSSPRDHGTSSARPLVWPITVRAGRLIGGSSAAQARNGASRRRRPPGRPVSGRPVRLPGHGSARIPPRGTPPRPAKERAVRPVACRGPAPRRRPAVPRRGATGGGQVRPHLMRPLPGGGRPGDVETYRPPPGPRPSGLRREPSWRCG